MCAMRLGRTACRIGFRSLRRSRPMRYERALFSSLPAAIKQPTPTATPVTMVAVPKTMHHAPARFIVLCCLMFIAASLVWIRLTCFLACCCSVCAFCPTCVILHFDSSSLFCVRLVSLVLRLRFPFRPARVNSLFLAALFPAAPSLAPPALARVRVGVAGTCRRYCAATSSFSFSRSFASGCESALSKFSSRASKFGLWPCSSIIFT